MRTPILWTWMAGLCIAVCGCGTSGVSIIPMARMPVLEPTDPTTIEVLTEEPTRSHERLAIVIASETAGRAGTSTDEAETEAVHEARVRAGELGADAIILGGQSRDSLQTKGAGAGTSMGYGTTVVAGSSKNTLTITVRALAIRYTDAGAKADLDTPERRKARDD